MDCTVLERAGRWRVIAVVLLSVSFIVLMLLELAKARSADASGDGVMSS